jgi:hypothetical protein
MRETRTTCKIVTEKPHRKKLLGRQTWEDNIKTELHTNRTVKSYWFITHSSLLNSS